MFINLIKFEFCIDGYAPDSVLVLIAKILLQWQQTLNLSGLTNFYCILYVRWLHGMFHHLNSGFPFLPPRQINNWSDIEGVLLLQSWMLITNSCLAPHSCKRAGNYGLLWVQEQHSNRYCWMQIKMIAISKLKSFAPKYFKIMSYIDLKQGDCKIFHQKDGLGSVENGSLGPATMRRHMQIPACQGKRWLL